MKGRGGSEIKSKFTQVGSLQRDTSRERGFPGDMPLGS